MVCLSAARICQRVLLSEVASVHSWPELFAGARPQIQEEEQEAGSWTRGWQAVAPMAREEAAFNRLPTNSTEPIKALLRSQTGRGAGDWLLAVPTSRPLTIDATSFLLAFRRRLFMPLPLCSLVCPGCTDELDEFTHHILACTRTGWLKRPSTIHEMA